jgi:hypothetical protein
MAPKSACRVCGALVGAPVGKDCPPHQAAGSRAKCSGSGKSTVRI